MFRCQLKTSNHTKNQEYLKLIKRKINTNTEMIEMLELSDKDFKVVITKMLQ